MSLWERTGWTGGFPFSQTNLRPVGRGRVDAIDVTAATVPEAGTAPIRHRSWLRQGAPTGRIVVPDALSIRVGPMTRRHAPRKASLRLFPLGGFVWGSQSHPVRPRTRPDHTLIWVTGGTMRLDLPRQTVLLGAGDVRYVPSGTAFAATPQEGAEGHVLTISPELTSEVDPALPTQMTAGSVGQSGAALLVNLQELVREATNSPDRKALTCHLNLLSLRLSRLDPERQPHAPRSTPTADRPLVDRFVTLADQQLGSWQTLADMAQQLDATLTQLDRACIEAKGRRAVELLHELRLERAAEMLHHTDRPIGRIALDLGYASQTHMTRAFVTATGRTPETFRIQMRQLSSSPPASA
ncbi:helix-turn-helix domain-containing protein [Paracoccus sp. R86501]|uniref:helix-turn-helix domain-containing protein n=1 Tax=Paracoccus sp. R86501 TaxID=3101711 RepID=UPI00366C9AEE